MKTCCRKSTLCRKRVALTSPSLRVLILVRKAVLDAGTDPAGMLHPDDAPLPRGWWLSPHPCAPSGCSAEDFHPSKLILSGWSSQLGSWMRLSPSRITKAMKLLKDIQPFILAWISVGELLGNDLTHLCHHCRRFSEVNKGYLNYVYLKEFYLLQCILQSCFHLKKHKMICCVERWEIIAREIDPVYRLINHLSPTWVSRQRFRRCCLRLCWPHNESPAVQWVANQSKQDSVSRIPGEKMGTLKSSMRTRPAISHFIVWAPPHSWGLLWSNWLTCWMRQMHESPFSSCLAEKSLTVAVPVWVAFPSVHLNYSLAGWNFIRMLYLPLIKCQKQTRVCVLLYESGLQFSSAEHLLFGEVTFISNRHLVLPPNPKARLGWVLNLFLLSSMEEMPMTSRPELGQELDRWKFRALTAVETLPTLGVAVGPNLDSSLCASLHRSREH